MNDVMPGVPILGLVTRTLEPVTPEKGAKYHRITVNTYKLGYVSVRIYGEINPTMKAHLEKEGVGILVNADSVSPWVPETDGTPKRYTKEGTYRTGKVIINYGATANPFRLEFLPKVTTESSKGTADTQAASSGDTVRGGDDSQGATPEETKPTETTEKATSGEGQANPWAAYQK